MEGSGEPAVLRAALGWGSRLATINTASSSVCPALCAAPRGKGWPQANIRRCAPLSPAAGGGGWGAWGLAGGHPGLAAPLASCLLPTPSGS